MRVHLMGVDHDRANPAVNVSGDALVLSLRSGDVSCSCTVRFQPPCDCYRLAVNLRAATEVLLATEVLDGPCVNRWLALL
jgi:hypothetical protein